MPDSGDDKRESNGATASVGERTSPPPGVVPPDAVFGQVVLLMMSMPNFRHVFLTDLEWMVLPPIVLGQHRLFRVDNRVVAFAAWAHLSEAAEARLEEPNPRLAPGEWKSGDRLWLINLFAPFGHQDAALKELRETAFAGKTFKMHRVGADGRRVVEVMTGAMGTPRG